MSATTSHPGPTTALSAFARRHPLTLFFALAYAFTWWAWIWYRLDPVHVDAPMFPPGPLVAALVVLALTGGRPALRAFLRKIVHWRVRPVWYVFALLVPVVLTVTAVVVARATGAAFTADRVVPGAAAVAAQFAFVLLWVGLGEEPAWRGYALPRLMVGRTTLTAALVLGVLHVLWHLPLFGVEYDLANGAPWALSVLAFSVVTAWVWTHTGGSLLLPMLMHASVNSVTFVWRWFGGPDQLRLWWIWAALWVVLAVGVVVAGGPQLGRTLAVESQGKP